MYLKNTKIIRIVSIILSLITIGCISKNTKDFTIGVSQCSDDEWRSRMNEEIMREALFYPNLNVEIRTAYDDNNKQIKDIEEFIYRKVDLIVVAPNEAKAITPIVEKAYKSNIPIVLVDRKIASDKFTSFVGGDNYELGKQVGTYIANRLKGKGDIVELTGLRGSTSAVERQRGMKDILKKYPSIKIIATADAGWLKEKAKCKFDSILKVHDNIDMVFAQNDRMALGAYEAAKEVGKEKDLLFVGVDALAGKKQGVELVADSIFDATFIYPTGGDKVIEIAMNILENRAFKKENILSSALVNSSNARIMLMQNSHIYTLTDKIKILNNRLDLFLMRYSSQKMFLYACIIILILLAILLFFIVKAYWTKIRLNTELSNQKKQLEEQRDQLIVLSQKLEDATKAKLAFFTNVSHDFRTPLTLIADPVKRLMKSNRIADEDKDLLNIINKNVTVLLRLINQIMDFRKFENGKLEMHLSEFNLKEHITSWAEAFKTLSHKKNIKFSVNSDSNDFNIIADAEMMERITYNILSNSFKFTPDNGVISIDIYKDCESEISIRFSDSGIGMPAEHINHIFDSFYQIDVHHAGTGIGLAMVKAFVEMHHGSIKVNSKESHGTVFTITIPVKQSGMITHTTDRNNLINNLKEGAVIMAESNITPTYPVSNDKEDISKESILIIDDNQEIREYIKSILSDKYSVMEASDGREGLKAAIESIPNVIICDVMMPVMDGMECCRKLKSETRTSHIPVIMLTAYSMDEQKIKGYECGADSYISKPFNSDLLIARIKNITENRKKLKEFFTENAIIYTEPIADIDKGFVERLKELIENNIGDSSFNVECMGEKIGFSRVQLYRKTKALTGYSPNELLRITRLNKAKAIILSTKEKSISEIAYEVGFSSPSYFTKCYKEFFGVSPTEEEQRIQRPHNEQ